MEGVHFENFDLFFCIGSCNALMYNIYVAGNYLVKFDLITDSHLLDIGCQSLPFLKRGVKEKIIPKKAHKNITFLLSFPKEDISGDKCSKNPNGVNLLNHSVILIWTY